MIRLAKVVILGTTSSTSMVFSWMGLVVVVVSLFLMLFMMVQVWWGAGDVSHFSIHSKGSSGTRVS